MNELAAVSDKLKPRPLSWSSTLKFRMYLMKKQRSVAVACLLLGVGALACSAPSLGGNDADGNDVTGDGDAGGDGDSAGDGDAGGDGDDGGGGGSTDLPDGVATEDLLPSRIRRLTNDEYDASVQALLGTSRTPSDNFPPDSRQHGYTVNEAQRVDPILARGLDNAAMSLIEEARPRFGELAPCDDPAGAGRDCAASFVDTFAREAYRRPVKGNEKEALLALYDAATTGEGLDPSLAPDAVYADGIALMMRGILQSPGFLYITETGGVDMPSGEVVLTSYELAQALAYLLTAAPPDAQLEAAAEAGTLTDSAVREAEARRLLDTPAGRQRAIEVIEQWLGIDRIEVTSKDAMVYPDFSGLRDLMAQEAAAFISGVLDADGGKVQTLLAAGSAAAPGDLSAMYAASGPVRNGLLNQGAFLSVYAHAHETSPVLRGTAVLRRVGCIDIEIPTSLNLEIVPPVPDPTQTTRERFGIHSQDPECRGCHDSIDPLGFVFEQFDGMGKHRTTENDKPVDSSGVVAIGKDFDGSYQSSTELAVALGMSADAAECFARQMFRAHAAEASGISESEGQFVAQWGEVPADPSFIETMVAFVKSDAFIYRKEGLQ